MLDEQHIPFSHRGRPFELVVGPGWQVALYCQGCLRKQRSASVPEVLYVWTNVELEWEEHHLVEARLVPTADGAVLRATVNGDPLLEQAIPAA